MVSSQLSGRQKAAALLIALGPEECAKVMKFLDPLDVERLTFEILNLEKVPQELKLAALIDCHEQCFGAEAPEIGGSNYARDVLERALGPRHAAELLSKISAGRKKSPFEFLRVMDPSQLATFLQSEHPQTVSLILAHLEPRLAGQILMRLDSEVQADVARRVAAMERTSPEAVSEVQDVVRRRLSSMIGRDFSVVGGVECLVGILGQANRATERTILDSLELTVPELAEEVRKHLFVFDDVARLDDRSVQRVLREVDGKDLALALKLASEDVKDRILKNVSARAARALTEDVAAMGPVRLRQVEEAQQRIVATVRRLDEAEEIAIHRGGDSDVFL
ncbi:MAG: flagellar motor switch protein FliG [Dehalococcoidales bacterium]|nr:flagellar motor switch protein FliG [Dehalococcoidales bacterium]